MCWDKTPPNAQYMSIITFRRDVLYTSEILSSLSLLYTLGTGKEEKESTHLPILSSNKHGTNINSVYLPQ